MNEISLDALREEGLDVTSEDAFRQRLRAPQVVEDTDDDEEPAQ